MRNWPELENFGSIKLGLDSRYYESGESKSLRIICLPTCPCPPHLAKVPQFEIVLSIICYRTSLQVGGIAGNLPAGWER